MTDLQNFFTAESLFTWVIGGVALLTFAKTFFGDLDFFKKRTTDKIHKENEHRARLESIETKLDAIIEKQTGMDEKIEILMESDKEDIKTFMDEKHRELMARGSITTRELEIVYKRYDSYKSEHGNSFVHKLVQEMSALPIVE